MKYTFCTFYKNALLLLLFFLLPVGGAVADLHEKNIKAAINESTEKLQRLASEAEVIEAVRKYNDDVSVFPGMTNSEWKRISVMDARMEALKENPLVQKMKNLLPAYISELFISGKDGGKVAFFEKPSSWIHKGMKKHDLPMQGKIWVGHMELDESSGTHQIQLSVPIFDSGKPIGSIVAGIALARIDWGSNED